MKPSLKKALEIVQRHGYRVYEPAPKEKIKAVLDEFEKSDREFPVELFQPKLQIVQRPPKKVHSWGRVKKDENGDRIKICSKCGATKIIKPNPKSPSYAFWTTFTYKLPGSEEILKSAPLCNSPDKETLL